MNSQQQDSYTIIKFFVASTLIEAPSQEIFKGKMRCYAFLSIKEINSSLTPSQMITEL
ncbi:hypothetical protein Murru_2723 [Allomuricauda ruestringensis DSM 13258]|uniref:Uncharacterized protein n=1 Tax=Allomuricauda ruestringensis (strain DSM 13258 / CIP 107369 / LMG 19739 / B1) TaxID=886377 RepID=G2PID5_ALLRU|nr:hypothetical protein Murru_2723 [Allomuricauda ruestringensis DSM 13258]